MSSEAYIMGLFAGDGWFESRGISIGTNNETFAVRIWQMMSENFQKKVILKKRKYSDGHEMFIVSLHSKEIHRKYQEALKTTKKKSKTFQVPAFNTKEEKRSFVAGLIDAEGYFYFWKQKIPRVALEIFNENAALFIKNQLQNDEITASVSKCKDGGFRIDITGSKNVTKLFELYPLMKLSPHAG